MDLWYSITERNNGIGRFLFYSGVAVFSCLRKFYSKALFSWIESLSNES